MIDDTRCQTIREVFEQQAVKYPELTRHPSYHDLIRICHAEGVTVAHDPRLPTAGALIDFLGSWTLFLSDKLAVRLAPPTIVHELGHLWCHATAEPVYATSIEEDPREEEADYFVSLVYGPDYFVFPIADLRPDDRGFFLDRRAPRCC